MKAFEILVASRPNTPDKRRVATKAALPFVRAYTRAIHEFYDQFLAMWQRQNRPQGLETVQIRLRGCVVRAEEALRRFGEFVRGKADDLPELGDALKVLGSDYADFTPLIWHRVAHGTLIV